MQRKKPPAFGATLAGLRFREGWQQRELAAEHGLTGSALSKLESGDSHFDRERLDALAATMGLKPEVVDRALAGWQEVEDLQSAAALPTSPLAAAERETRWAAGQLGKDLEGAGRSEFGPLAGSLAVEKERADGREAAAWLLGRPRADWPLLVRGAREYQGQAVCMAVCELSVEAAADKPERALELARLAVLIAEQTPEDLALQGFAQAHLGNAWRVAGKPRTAAPVMGEAKVLWEQGEEEPGILPPARILDLEASLLRAQRRFGEALALLERALELSPDAASRGRVLLNKGFTLEQQGNLEGAVAALRQAAPLIDTQAEPRQACVLRYNLTVILLHAGRLDEAAELIDEVWDLAGELGLELDLLRTRWLGARLLAARGRIADAAAELQEVQEAFARRGILSDTGLATLELAALRLELGQDAEVQELARQTYEILVSQGVQREALGSLLVFFQAAERRTVTRELVHELLDRCREQAPERGLEA
jgi:tetratricopeptide (TPR) repeat protein/transcriptional regulator with XRE-family HTH domain